MKKKIAMVSFAALVACAVFGRTVELDLSRPAPEAGRGVTVRPHALLASGGTAQAGVSHPLRSFRLDAGAADAGEIAVGDRLVFTLFDDVTMTLTLKEASPSFAGRDVFLAEAEGYEGVTSAVVLRSVDGLTIEFHDFLNNRLYKVISSPGGVKVAEIEPVSGSCGADTRACECTAPAAQSSSYGHPAPKAAKLLGGASEAETFVDILVAYDGGASAWVADNGGVTNFAVVAVARMNSALANTGIDQYFRFRLVGIECVSAMSSDLNEALDSATFGYTGWEAISAKRDECGADIVSVLIDTGSESGTTGLGWSLNTTDFASFSERAYNACAVRSVAQSHTMTHEVGHNMGAGHSDVQQTDPGPQLFEYSAGYYVGGYCTIMAYETEGPLGTQIPCFSSPNYYYYGFCVGDEMHNNTLTIINTYSAVAQWRTAASDEIGGDEDLLSAPLEWLTSRDEAIAKAKAENKKVFLVQGRDTCSNTESTRKYSCENPSVKRYLSRNYVCWYCSEENWSEAWKYFYGFDVGGTLPSIAVIDPESDETLVAAGGYHNVTDLRILLGRVEKEVTFTPGDGTRFADSLELTMTGAPGAEIYYSLDGSMPPSDTSQRYEGPLTITNTVMIRAVAYADGAWGLPIDAKFAKSSSEQSGGFEWIADVVDGGCIITAIEPAAHGDIAIPSTIGGVAVIGLREGLFEGNEAITSVSIPGSITEILDNAFHGCSSLARVEIGDGVRRIGENAFRESGLAEVLIPASVEEIGICAFSACSKMTAATVDGGNANYSSRDGFIYDKGGTHLVYCPAGLKYVEIPNGVTHIDICALSYSWVERVVLPKSLVEIGEGAFTRCDLLEEVAIPETVTNIGYSAFDYCQSLEHAYLPAALESDDIQYNSFYRGIYGFETILHYYSGALVQNRVHFDVNGGELVVADQILEFVDGAMVTLASLPVPERTDYSFLGWFTQPEGGEEVTGEAVIADGTTLYAHWKAINYVYTYRTNEDGTITLSQYNDNGQWVSEPISPAPVGKFTLPSEIDGKTVVAFEGFFLSCCDEVTELTIPSSITNVVDYSNLYGPQSFVVAPDNPAYRDIDGVLYSKDGKTLVAYPRGGPQDVVVAPGTERIGHDAFYNNNYLTSITLPDGLLYIDEYAFAYGNGWSFTELTIPASVVAIGEYAFSDTPLENVVFEGDEAAIAIDATAFLNTPYEDSIPVFTVTFDAAGGSLGETERRVKRNGAVGDLPYPANDAGVFIGWYTARDGGEKVDASLTVTGDIVLYARYIVQEWITSKEDAMAAAKSEGKWVLLVSGRDTCPNTSYFRFYSCASPENAMELDEGYVLWYNNIDEDYYDIWDYRSGIGGLVTLPIVCVIDPEKPEEFVLRSTGFADEDDLAGMLASARAKRSDKHDGDDSCPNCQTDPGEESGNGGGTSDYYYVDYTSVEIGEEGYVHPNDTNIVFTVGQPYGESLTRLTANAQDEVASYSHGFEISRWVNTAKGNAVVTSGTIVQAGDKLLAQVNMFNPLCRDDDGEVDASAALVYDGYVVDEDGVCAGMVSVKVGKENAKTGLASVSATLQMLGAKKLTFKAEEKGKAPISSGDVTSVTLVNAKSADDIELEIAADALDGYYGDYRIFGTKNVAKKSAATYSPWVGRNFAVVLEAFDVSGSGADFAYGNSALAVKVMAKGKVKVSGTMADGTRVSATAQLLVTADGREACAAVVVPLYTGKTGGFSFMLWLDAQGNATVEGISRWDASKSKTPFTAELGGFAGRAGIADGYYEFGLDDGLPDWVSGAEVLKDEDFSPSGTSVTVSGGRISVPKADKVKYDAAFGEVINVSENGNPAGLKLSYTASTGVFKGSFSVYTLNGTKLRKLSAKVTGMFLDGTGYGTATIKKVGSWPVWIE